MYLKIYVSDEEHAWAKEEAGRVRRLIQAAMMNDGKTVEIPTIAKRARQFGTTAKTTKAIFEMVEAKNQPKEPGWCEKGHWVGVGFKKCKLCGSKVR